MTHRKSRWLVAFVFIGSLVALFGHYKERTTFRCQSCWAKRDVFQWRFGSWSGYSVPISSKKEKIGDTQFLKDFIPATHNHDWVFAQGSPYLFFGTSWAGCGIGSGRYVSQICNLYESFPEFRIFIKERLNHGGVSKSQIIDLASHPRGGEPPEIRDEVTKLIDSFWDHLPSEQVHNTE